ncbi:hypothetical protein VNO78_25209 [Psophocarpus tetragonolobus]|uniref:Uncharacterized protein n=1 Tax=Psophocarpus tetragonolobus TaxID=3891 RepID=A0AAN9S653_PSOTE
MKLRNYPNRAFWFCSSLVFKPDRDAERNLKEVRLSSPSAVSAINVNVAVCGPYRRYRWCVAVGPLMFVLALL